MSKRNELNTLNLDAFKDLSAADIDIIASILAVLAEGLGLLAVLKAKEEATAAKNNAK
ncbi:hypothetical protein J2T13_005089 [Paenibacillus sp. DS2015]|uniref:hypothetical protein n=1 Tax=Paenibacillus sp. DS2015 TaxID=3373917 RepID=UPI003D220CA6